MGEPYQQTWPKEGGEWINGAQNRASFSTESAPRKLASSLLVGGTIICSVVFPSAPIVAASLAGAQFVYEMTVDTSEIDQVQVFDKLCDSLRLDDEEYSFQDPEELQEMKQYLRSFNLSDYRWTVNVRTHAKKEYAVVDEYTNLGFSQRGIVVNLEPYPFSEQRYSLKYIFEPRPRS